MIFLAHVSCILEIKTAAQADSGNAMFSNNKKNQQPSFRWNSEIATKKIEATTDCSWFLYKSISVPNAAEFFFKVGNKDYALDLENFNSQRQKLSEFALKKKHG